MPDYARALMQRLEEPFKTPWRKCSPLPDRNGHTHEAEAVWLIQDWQKRLWGAAWVWRHQAGADPWRGTDDAAMKFCSAWERLYRRSRALSKLLSDDAVARVADTRSSRYRKLSAELQTRFPPSRLPTDLRRLAPSESRPDAFLGHVAQEY